MVGTGHMKDGRLPDSKHSLPPVLFTGFTPEAAVAPGTDEPCQLLGASHTTVRAGQV